MLKPWGVFLFALGLGACASHGQRSASCSDHLERINAPTIDAGTAATPAVSDAQAGKP